MGTEVMRAGHVREPAAGGAGAGALALCGLWPEPGAWQWLDGLQPRPLRARGTAPSEPESYPVRLL